MIFFKKKKPVSQAPRIVSYTVPHKAVLFQPDFRVTAHKTAATISTCNEIELATAPHILIAGSTGSGKSVCINTMLLSLLVKNSPFSLELYIIDPKMIDYIEYKNLPHTKKYATDKTGAEKLIHEIHCKMFCRLEYMVAHEMKTFQGSRILLVFDELASLRIDTTELNDILRLGRAANISVILATQRPDRTVINGQLKSNCPVRIAFKLPSSIDSRIILDSSGAEKLHGSGNGILINQYGDRYIFNGTMVSENQKKAILEYWKNQF